MQNETDVETDADLTSGYLSRRYGVSHRTLRYYEDKGLLTPKHVGDIRLFSSQDVVRLEIILAAKKLGLPLNEVGNIIQSHQAEPKVAPKHVGATEDFVTIQRQLSLLEAQRVGLEAAIGELNALLIGKTTSAAEE